MNVTSTPEDPHAPVSRSPVELARERVERGFSDVESQSAFRVARALLAAEKMLLEHSASLDPESFISEVLSVLRGSDTA